MYQDTSIGYRAASYTYDKDGRVTAVTYPDGGKVGYVYDEVGNLQTITYPGGEAVEYSYDSCRRPVSARDSQGKETAADTITMAYDVANRLTSMTGSEGTAAYTYDAGGSLTARELNGKTDTYRYDYANRLAEYTGADGTQVNYTYSAEGYLLAKETTGSSTTWYTYAYGQERIASYQQTGSNTEHTGYFYDVRGSVIEMFTGDAESSQEKVRPAAEEYIEEYISKRYRCTPYGEQIVKEGETEEGGLQCNGEDYDRVTGLICLRARWYNPKEARFFQPDIIR